MELHELGRQYIDAADRLNARVRLLNLLADSLSGNDKIFVRRRVYSLYGDSLRCRKTGKYLISYRKKGAIVDKNEIQP